MNYAGDSYQYHRLDIYLPIVAKSAYPAVILIYGSAWFGNNLKESDLSTIGKALLDAGFAVVTPNHRSSMDAKFPAQIHDIKAAIRFVRANAGTYQIDTSFIGITGSSSGGHLAALAGTSGFVKQYTFGSAAADLEGSLGPDTAFSSSVHAVVDWFGPTDFLVMDSCGSSLVHNDPNSPESSLLGGPIQDNKDKCALANPITYIDSNDPPFLILHGDADPLVPHCNSELLFNALQNAGVTSQFVLVPDGQHGPGLFIDQYFEMMGDFFATESGITKVDAGEGSAPAKFSVIHNYPNPFNPATTITFTLPVKSFVTLKVFDSLGKEVTNLVSEEMQPGTYTRQWNAEEEPSGTYFYRLEAGSFTETKKLVLIK
ncbi:MAG: prolyl oligopeptidase family serine peptidase [Ignavibacteria bacterium]